MNCRDELEKEDSCTEIFSRIHDFYLLIIFN